MGGIKKRRKMKTEEISWTSREKDEKLEGAYRSKSYAIINARHRRLMMKENVMMMMRKMRTLMRKKTI